MKIVFVEDDADARTLFTRKLQAAGFECEAFPDGEQALKALRPGACDLLIIDIRLPGMSGVQLLSRLRAAHVHTPCVLITAFNSLEYMRQALNASAAYLLEKPFSIDTLRKVIAQVTESPGSLQHCVDRGLSQLRLTEREETVARYLLKGLSNAEIAEAAGLSEKTVKQHVTQIFEKGAVASRAEFFSLIFPT